VDRLKSGICSGSDDRRGVVRGGGGSDWGIP
jgi:hypothetical protein